MRVVGVGRTDVGKKRNHNEDYMLLAPELGLFIVCDGMGGHAAGEVASENAARIVRRVIEEHRGVLDRYDDTGVARDELVRLVDQAITLASREVYQIATSDQGKAGMGTTLTMLLWVRNVGVMGHVGDSRLYMRRSGKLHQLSEDHTYVNEMVRRGMGNIEELKKGPYANVITRAVGIQPSVRADTLIFDVLPGDCFLLCSDGLVKHVESSDELLRMLGNDHLESIPQQLVDIANSRGGTDNISALVLRADADQGEETDDRARTTELNLKLDTLKEISLFRHLDMGELCKVLNVVQSHSVDAGEVVVREGEAGDSLYAILDGKFVVRRSDQAVAWLGAGSHFGEMSLFNERPRSATIEAIQPSRVLAMDRDRFNELIRKEPQLGVKLLWAFARVLSLRLDETSVQLYGNPADRDTAVNAPFPLPRGNPHRQKT